MFDKIINLLLPKKCIFCKKEGSFLCEDCLSLVEINEKDYCLCDHPKVIDGGGKCPLCRNEKLDALFSACSLEQPAVKKIINKMKNGYMDSLAYPLAMIILSHLSLVGKDISGYVIVPIPLPKEEERRRGFNQVRKIAEVIAAHTSLPLLSKCLIKTKEGKKINQGQKEEIASGYALKGNNGIVGSKIILLDDIYTSGSAMKECAKILKENGALEVIGLVVGREPMNS